MMIYTVTLCPAIDYELKTGPLVAGEINRAHSAVMRCAGKGVNVSIVLNRLGSDNLALGFEAGRIGKLHRDLMDEMGVHSAFTRLENGETRINVKIVSDGEYAINARGACASLRDVRRLTDRLLTADPGDFVVLTGSVPPGLPPDLYAGIMKEYENKRLRFVVDAQGAQLKSAIAQKPFLVKPNLEELTEYFDANLRTEAEIFDAARAIREQGALNVLVSMADRGALLLDEHGTVHKLPATTEPVVSTVGCGDSVVAGFITGYLRYGDYNDAFTLGVACGNAAAGCVGLPDLTGINEEYEKLKRVV